VTPCRRTPQGLRCDEVLDAAIEVFWRYGYQGASLQELTAAMGINKASLYAAFGSKEDLFHRAVARYAETDMAYALRALNERQLGTSSEPCFATTLRHSSTR